MASDPSQRLAELTEILELAEGVCVTDGDFRVTYVNAAQERISGVPRALSLGRRMQELWPEAFAPGSTWGERYHRCMQDRVPQEFEAFFAPLDKWFDVVVQPISTGGMGVYFRDITLRKQSERELGASEARLRLLVEHSPAAIALIDHEYRFLAHSLRYLRDYNLAGPIVGRSVFEVFTNLEGRWKTLLEQAQAGQTCSGDDDLYVAVDGTQHFLHWEFAPWHHADGRVGGVVVFTEEISRLKQSEEALRVQVERTQKTEAQLRQAQKMEAIGQLAGGVAHDFNNLLTVILSSAESLREGLEPGSSLHEDAVQVSQSGERAAALTRQLLAFSRRQLLAPREVNLNSVVQGMAPMLSRLLGEQVELGFVLGEQLGSCRVDPNQFEQVVMNLCVNARDAMPRGGRLIIETSNVELEELDGEGMTPSSQSLVCLAVTDTGEGMTREVRERLFEPFFTTKELGRGTGLGLSTVYGIVQQSGGTIRVYSEPGLGTTFRVYFPRLGEPAAAAPRPTTAPLRSGHETLLLVEDDQQVKNAVMTMLTRAGYTVLSALSPAEALAVARQHPGVIDLLVTDVVMPRMNGRELAEALRAERPGLRVLFMSGYTGETMRQNGFLGPGLHFISKPFVRDALLAEVRACLDADDGGAERL